jgi:hypothetical protein
MSGNPQSAAPLPPGQVRRAVAAFSADHVAHLETEVERLVGELARAHEDIQLGLAREAKLEDARQAAGREALVQRTRADAAEAELAERTLEAACHRSGTAQQRRATEVEEVRQATEREVLRRIDTLQGELTAAERKIDEQASALCSAGLTLYRIANNDHKGSWPAEEAREALAQSRVLTCAVALDRARREVCEAALRWQERVDRRDRAFAEDVAVDERELNPSASAEAVGEWLTRSDAVGARRHVAEQAASMAEADLNAGLDRLRAVEAKEDRDGGH